MKNLSAHDFLDFAFYLTFAFSFKHFTVLSISLFGKYVVRVSPRDITLQSTLLFKFIYVKLSPRKEYMLTG